MLSASTFTLVISEQFPKKYSPIFSTDDGIESKLKQKRENTMFLWFLNFHPFEKEFYTRDSGPIFKIEFFRDLNLPTPRIHQDVYHQVQYELFCVKIYKHS